MTDEERALRLVTDTDGAPDRTGTRDPADPTVPDLPSAGAESPVQADPLEALVRQIEDLPLDERPAAFERLNANLVAALNALEEV